MVLSDRYVSLDWGHGGTVSVSVGKFKRATVPVADVRKVPGVLGSDVVVPHAAGPNLAMAAVRIAADVGTSAFIESDGGDLCPLVGTAAGTLYVWASGDPGGHPADRILPYAYGGEPAALASVIGAVFDPRWYFGPLRRSDMAEERPSRVEARLGLTPRWDRSDSVHRATVTRAWRSLDGGGHNFFDRMYHEDVITGVPEVVAERRTGRYFIRCVIAAWSDVRNGGDPLFDPSILFGSRA